MGNKSDRKKELLLEYKKNKVLGGVYKITNTVNERYWLNAATNIQGHKNRFDFSQKTNSCLDKRLEKDWNEYGAESFAFEILEEIEMIDTQTMKEFKEDLKVLEKMWAETFEPVKAY